MFFHLFERYSVGRIMDQNSLEQIGQLWTDIHPILKFPLAQSNLSQYLLQVFRLKWTHAILHTIQDTSE